MSVAIAESPDPTVQYSPLYHERTCGIKPILGRTIIRRHQAKGKVGSIFLPDESRGRWQSDWQAEVVANAEQGGWRMGDLQEFAESQYSHMTEWPAGEIPKAIRRNKKLWKVAPYYVDKPVIAIGTRIICCWAAGQPFHSANGYDYFLTDGEHAYKAVVNS